MSERAAPQYCPYCGDEDLRPEPDSHRAWHCRSCARAFELAFLGLRLNPDSEHPSGDSEYTPGLAGVDSTASRGADQ